MEFLDTLAVRVGDLMNFMDTEMVPELPADYQEVFYEKVKKPFEELQRMAGEGALQLTLHSIGPMALKDRKCVLKIRHYLADTGVPAKEIVKFYPKGCQLIDEPERMFREAKREHLVKLFDYFDQFGTLYYLYLKKEDPLMAVMMSKHLVTE